MSFDTIESSQELGAPFELYEFVYGDVQEATYRYTNFDRDLLIDTSGKIVINPPLTAEGTRYYARPISREAYKSNGKTERTSLNIKISVDTDLSTLFTDWPPTQVVRVTIKAGHINDEAQNIVVIWVGRVLSVAKEKNAASLTCENTIISLKRPGLTRNWQYACPWVLYGVQCGAVTPQISTHVVSVTSLGVVLTTGWFGGHDVSKFKGGMIRWRGNYGWEFRTIRNTDSDGGIAFIGPVRNIEVGQEVQIYFGCNHTMDDCRDVHNNINNYGGDPWIPLENPVLNHPYW